LVPLWVFIVVLVVCVGIVVYDKLKNGKFYDEYDKVCDAYDEVMDSYSNLTKMLGYYRLRFGIVSVDDINNMVGIDMEKLNEEIEYGKGTENKSI
jgi:hypothetical protein